MAKTPRNLHGQVAVITGAARGIGKATAHALARRGVKVAIGDLDPAAAERAAAEVGGGAIGLRLDVTDRPGFTAFLDEVERRLGPIDILINNAGVMPIGPFDEESEATVTRQLEINLHAVVHGTKEAVRRMKSRGHGHIVNLASIAGIQPLGGAATYSATKHGVVGLTETVRMELAGSGVDISYVCPGHVRTELTAGVKEQRLIRAVTAEEVAEAIAGVLERPAARVFVPRRLGPATWANALLPRRAADFMTKVLKSDRTLLDFDHVARTSYETRVAASAPTAEIIVAKEEEPARV
jgi:NAD(P)-dependent dehydrogenase (short-subunit alcohol dehydrogenase family)